MCRSPGTAPGHPEPTRRLPAVAVVASAITGEDAEGSWRTPPTTPSSVPSCRRRRGPEREVTARAEVLGPEQDGMVTSDRHRDHQRGVPRASQIHRRASGEVAAASIVHQQRVHRAEWRGCFRCTKSREAGLITLEQAVSDYRPDGPSSTFTSPARARGPSASAHRAGGVRRRSGSRTVLRVQATGRAG